MSIAEALAATPEAEPMMTLAWLRLALILVGCLGLWLGLRELQLLVAGALFGSVFHQVFIHD